MSMVQGKEAAPKSAKFLSINGVQNDEDLGHLSKALTIFPIQLYLTLDYKLFLLMKVHFILAQKQKLLIQ